MTSISKLILKHATCHSKSVTVIHLYVWVGQDHGAMNGGFLLGGMLKLHRCTGACVYHNDSPKCVPTLLHANTPSSRIQVLMAYPELECWTGWHWVYVGIGAVGMVVYLLGLPCGIGLILYKIQTRKLHTDHYTLLAFGALYTKYEAQSWWYEIVQVRAFVPALLCTTIPLCHCSFLLMLLCANIYLCQTLLCASTPACHGMRSCRF